MKILGISGLAESVPWKRRAFPGLAEREYRIAQGLDSAAALVVDGEIRAAAAEERFDRVKHSAAFPAAAIRACLAEAGVAAEELDAVAHGFDYAPYSDWFETGDLARARFRDVFAPEAVGRQLRAALPDACWDRLRLHSVEHHRAHAASAYYTSGWDECLVAVMDGMGEAESATFWHARAGALEKLHAIGARDSIGVLYSIATLHLGFEFNCDEYKVMGLAPYGDPGRHRAFFERAVQLSDDGILRIPMLALNRTPLERETYAATRGYLAESLGAPRAPDAPITDAHCDVAAALQACLDRTVLRLCSVLQRKTGLRRLALAGGVALNCTMTGRLAASRVFDEVHVPPAAGDDGTALGAALDRAAAEGEVSNRRMRVPFLGPAPRPAEVTAALARFADRVRALPCASPEELCRQTAERIGAGEVVGWYRGRMEFGPRALGHRSLLADPSRPEMRERVNALVKKRESFRPFAPAVAEEAADGWFAMPARALPYMTTIVDVRPERRTCLPAVTHVDGTARVQTVAEGDEPVFHRLLVELGRRTGRPIVLNTSFNVRGQPIVRTPDEAIETFLAAGVDALALEDVLVTKR